MNLFELSAILTLNTTAYKQGLKDAEAQASGSRLGSIFSTIGSVAAGGLAVAVGAVGSLTKAATESYADYEQLKGGVETLFGTGGQSLEEYAQSVGLSVSEAEGQYDRLKTAEQLVMENADKAFKTAGLSANDYMEQATSTAAALISSLDGDTVQAAKLADQAITDMSDNANKMGTDIESIQNAYGGFAKGNFTMLDNLKLGYGGTKEEMQRLLNKAEEISGYKYDISSYSDIVEAIHVVQEEMGITGTTMKEAEGTINGSLGMVKASWKDLLTSFGRGGEETKEAIKKLVESCSSYLQNIIPVISEILLNIGQALPEIVPVIVEQLPILIAELLPPLLEAAWSLVTSLITELPTILGSLFDMIINLFKQVDWLSPVGEAMEGVKSVVSEGMEIIGSVLSGAWDNIKIVASVAWDGIATIIGLAFDVIKTLWNTILKPVFTAITDILNNTLVPAFKEVFEKLLAPAFENFISTIKNLWENSLKPIIEGIAIFVSGVFAGDWKKAWEGIRQIFAGWWEGIKTLVSSYLEQIKILFSGAWNLISNTVSSIWNGLKNTASIVFEGIRTIVERMMTGIESLWERVLSPVFSAIASVISGLFDAFKTTFSNITSVVSGAFSTIKSAWERVLSVAFAAISGGLEWLQQLFSNIWQAITGIVSGAMDTIRGLWDSVLSPVFSKIGEGLNNVRSYFANIWSAITAKVSDAFSSIFESFTYIFKPTINGIKNVLDAINKKFSRIFQNIYDIVVDIFSGIRSVMANFIEFWSNAFDNIGEIASNILGGVAETISDAWEAVKGFAGKISNLFNGGGSSSGYLSPYDVEWHAKANNQPYMFSGATLFGAGESGDEILYGRDSLMNDIRTAVSGGSNNDKLYNLLAEYLPEILDRSSKEIVLDDGTLVGRIDRRMGGSMASYRRGI